MKKTIDNLAKQAVAMNAGQAHMELGGILGDDNLTAVISVYNGVRPANTILDELYEWAQEHELTTVVEKIDQLETKEEN